MFGRCRLSFVLGFVSLFQGSVLCFAGFGGLEGQVGAKRARVRVGSLVGRVGRIGKRALVWVVGLGCF